MFVDTHASPVSVSGNAKLFVLRVCELLVYIHKRMSFKRGPRALYRCYPAKGSVHGRLVEFNRENLWRNFPKNQGGNKIEFDFPKRRVHNPIYYLCLFGYTRANGKTRLGLLAQVSYSLSKASC